MKAIYFLVVTVSLALAMTSCSIDEMSQVNDTGIITFKAVVPYATRGTATTTNNLDDFSVWGWTYNSVVMANETVIKSGSGTYNTSETYFWPQKTVDFLAVSPVATADGSSDASYYMGKAFSEDEVLTEGGNAETYSGHVAEATIDPQSSKGTIRVNVPSDSANQLDLCYACTPEQNGGTVTMNFRHALSQIVFAARTTNLDEEIRIKGVSLCSVGNWGTYTLPFVTTGTNLDSDSIGTAGISDSQGSWEAGYVNKATKFSSGLNLGADGYITLPADGTSVTLTSDSGSLFLVPQEVACWDVATDHHLENVGAYFRVNCEIITDDGILWPSVEEREADPTMEYAEIAIPVNINLAEGYKYTYTFVFGEGAGYYPPDDPNDPESDEGATPVPFLPIRFDTNVDEFQLAQGYEPESDPDPIDYYQYIVDPYFLEYMQKFDRNGDGHLYEDELEYITDIDCSYNSNNNAKKATDFTGIEYYYNLESFKSYNATCTSRAFDQPNPDGVLDLSNNPNLTSVILSNGYSGSDLEASGVKTVLLGNTSITEIAEKAFYGCPNLTAAVLPEGAEKIGGSAFQNCTCLSSVTLPTTLKEIGSNAFRDCTALTSITLPEQLSEIGDHAFYGSGLHSIIIPDNVTAIGSGAFWLCENLASATLSKSLTALEDHVFYYCTSLESIEIPDGVTRIGSTSTGTATGETFGYCTKLSSVTLPQSLEMIGYGVFQNCDSLAGIEIPEKVGEIGDYAFQLCRALATITLPSNLKYLGKYAFDYCQALTTMSIPAISGINEGTFRGCSALTGVTISNDVTSIGDYAFYMCYRLSEANLPKSLTVIGDYAFSGDYLLTAVGTVPEGVTSIGKQAFYMLYLTEIDLPSTLTVIGDEAYSMCFLLTEATVRAETPPQLGNNVFYSIAGSATLYVPSTSVGAYGTAGWGTYFQGGVEAIAE